MSKSRLHSNILALFKGITIKRYEHHEAVWIFGRFVIPLHGEALYSGVRLQGKHLQGNFFEYYNNLGVRLQGKLFAYKGKILGLYSGVRSQGKNFETLFSSSEKIINLNLFKSTILSGNYY